MNGRNMANPTCVDCDEEGAAGFGSPPVWLCLDHLSERFAGIGATIEKLQGLYDPQAWRHADGSIRDDHMDAQPGDYYGTRQSVPKGPFRIEAYLRFVFAQKKRNPSWRWGQTYYNVLAAVRPDLVRQVQTVDGVNPFYNDSNIGDFMEFICERWETPVLTDAEQSPNL